MEEKPEKSTQTPNIKHQMVLYFSFAAFMVILNYLIQKLNQLYVFPYICANFGNIGLIQALYCSTTPYNMHELIGSIVAVAITYLIKFFLDKYLVFKKKGGKLKDTSQEFIKYFGFAILTTIENIGIQFIMTNFFGTHLEISLIVALSIGYATKFLLDRKYVFSKEY